jgi:uncharacterized protein YkwD
LPLVALAIVIGTTTTSAARVGPRDDEPIRAVLSSRQSGATARMLSTSSGSLQAKADPWRRYLASEADCPNGKRTDLPVARQIETVACLVNYARGRRGLVPLTVRPALSVASLVKAKAIERCQNFAHNPCGGDWTSAVRSTGFSGTFGENLYLASGRWGAPRMAVDSWLNSPSHRENLFDQEWREQGLALVRVRLGSYGAVTLWVNVLARG